MTYFCPLIYSIYHSIIRDKKPHLLMKKNLLSIIVLLMCACSAMAQDFAIGADIGWNTEMESKGMKWYNWSGEERTECTALMKELGMNAVRIRVWVNPEKHGNWCSKEDVLEKAKRAKALGMDVMIDFHYSDWWADPAKQNIPAAWEKLSFKKMQKALADHTVEVLTLLKDNGITPKWVQVGNETTNGLLWSVEMDPQTGWEKKDAEGKTIITKAMGHVERNPKQYGAFIGAGYDAVKSVFPNAIVIIHLDNGFDNDLYNRNLDIVKANGGKWDMIGMSLYPFWAKESGKEDNAAMTINDCVKNIRKVTKKYGCDVMIVETGYEVDPQNPWKMQQGRGDYASLIRRMKEDTEGRCKGVFYWEPECRPSQYKLGAFDEQGHPTDILRALVGIENGKLNIQNYDRRVVKIKTNLGDIYVELYNETPGHRDNFLRLAKSAALEGTLFHRVIEDFMIQGGDPDSKDAPKTMEENPAPLLGEGNVKTAEGNDTISAEIIYPRFFHKRGVLAAAREGDAENPTKASSSSQFYITWGKYPGKVGKNPFKPLLDYYKEYGNAGTPWLDGGYTVFGEVISGLEVVDKIQKSRTDSNDRPLRDARIEKMEVIY